MDTKILDASQKINEARGKLQEILRKGEKIGCGTNEIIRLEIIKKILRKSEEVKTNNYSKYQVLAIIAGVLIAFFYATNAHTHQGFSNIWLKWNYGSVNDQPVS